jgi:glucose/arabinose dehydrogenase
MKLFVDASEQTGRMRVNRKQRNLVQSLCLVLLLAVLSSHSLKAATLPAGFAETLVANGLSNPTAMAFAPDGRLFVCQQGGQLRVIKNGALLATPFVSLTVDSAGERGLLGIAFDPNFATNQFVYLYYTATTPAIHNRVSRFTANGDTVVSGSEVIILDLNNLSGATNHNGGAMHFGADGKLYIAVGENAAPLNSQTLNNLLGKILRINADGTIPADNPFFNTAAGVNRAIWALGLRNPYTFAFQNGTGRMFINDVGQNAWEEINDGIAGSNYGWPNSEGATTNPNYRTPLFSYAHGGPVGTTGCAITGGAFYNPPINQYPSDYVGKYFFADFCNGWIRRLDPSNNTASDFASGIPSPVDLQIGPDGYLYYLARGNGSVFKIVFTANQSPTISTHPASQTVPVGQPATFSVVASGTAPLGYQWQRNGNNITGANSSSYTLPSATVADNGAKFRVVVSNAFGSVTSNEATLTVQQQTVQFSAASYSTNEGAGSLAITVTRSFGTAGDVTVNYAANGGTALERNDYTTLVGTLRFLNGETSKTLTLLLTEDGFVDGSKTVNLTLSNPLGAVLGSPNLTTVTIADNDATPSAANPIDQVPNFVRQHYHDFLNRQPEPTGFQAWQDILNNCPPSGKDSNGNFCDRIEVSSDFFRSLEFQQRGFFVYRFYSSSYGRIPHYVEFIPDMARVSGFQSAAEEEASKVAFINDFMARQEFRNRYDSVTDPRNYVGALETAAGVVLANREALIADLIAGRKTRAEVLRAVAESVEVVQKYFNQAFVVMQYFGYLRRDPDALYLNWIDTLNQTGDYRVMVNGFLNSLEYRSRFGQQ